MSKDERYDIVIIGGGPNGMATAAYLARQIVDGDCPDALRPFQPGRLRAGAAETGRSIEEERAWKPI